MASLDTELHSPVTELEVTSPWEQLFMDNYVGVVVNLHGCIDVDWNDVSKYWMPRYTNSTDCSARTLENY